MTKVNLNFNEVVKTILEGETIPSTCFSMFHNFSLNNTFIAISQMKMRGIAISPIASFGKWKSLKRYVNKGEHAISLWMPCTMPAKDEHGCPVKDENGKQEYKTFFMFKNNWFAFSQTNGSDDFDINSLNDKVKNFDFCKMLKELNITLVDFDILNGNIQGFSKVGKNEIAILPIAQDKIMTLLHEVAHAVLHNDKEGMAISREIKEVEAESVAYMLGMVLGVSDLELAHSRDYIKGWLKANDIDEKTSKRILKGVNKIYESGVIKGE